MRQVQVEIFTGEAGTAFSFEHAAAAVVVDALRASATATMLLESGALEIYITREVNDAFALRRQHFTDALLFGERGGLPPEGFDGGNSPIETAKAAGWRVIFTTTTGAGRVVACRGASLICMGTVLHADALYKTLAAWAARPRTSSVPLVFIPAGLMDDPDFSAQEDEASALALARGLFRAYPDFFMPGESVSGYESRYGSILDRPDGLTFLFESAPHAEKLRRIGLGHEVAWCARMDVAHAVPCVHGWWNDRTPILRRGIPDSIQD